MASPPADLVLGHHLDGSPWYFDLATGGGNKKPSTITGSPAVSAGQFGNCIRLDQSTHDDIRWSGTGLVDGLLQTGCVSMWVLTRYTGSPATQQNFLYMGNSTPWANRVSIWHTSSGFLQFYVNNSSGSAVATFSAAFAGSNGTWFHFELNWDISAGASRAFVDGVQFASTSVGTGTRSASNNNLIMFGDYPGGPANQNYFYVDEFLAYDTVQHTSNFTPPAAPALLTYDTDLSFPALAGVPLVGRTSDPIISGMVEG